MKVVTFTFKYKLKERYPVLSHRTVVTRSFERPFPVPGTTHVESRRVSKREEDMLRGPRRGGWSRLDPDRTRNHLYLGVGVTGPVNDETTHTGHGSVSRTENLPE